MAQEIDGGIAYLRSLRRSVSPLAAAATGPARETGSDKHSGSGRAIADSGERFKWALKSGAAHAIRAKAAPNSARKVAMCGPGRPSAMCGPGRPSATCACMAVTWKRRPRSPPGPCCPSNWKAAAGRLETKGNGRVSYPYLGMVVPSWKCPKKTLDDCARCWPRSHGPPRSWDRDSIPRCRPAAPGMKAHGSPIPPLPYRCSPNFSRPPDADARRLPSHPLHQSEQAAITFMVSPANATVSLGTTR
jgi:hypothetical protein